MEVSRLTFRTILALACINREQLERSQLGYSTDSAMLAEMKNILIETEYDVSTIHLVD
jgi:hypothetical protein